MRLCRSRRRWQRSFCPQSGKKHQCLYCTCLIMHCQCFMCLSVLTFFHHSLFLHFPCTVPARFFSFTFTFLNFSYTFPSRSFTFLSLFFLHCSFTINFPSVSLHFLNFSFTFTFIVPSRFFYFFLTVCFSLFLHFSFAKQHFGFNHFVLRRTLRYLGT